MGRTPVAIGSSVPPWPAFSALSRRRARAITWVDVIPGGLSMTSQPWTGSPFRLRATAPSAGRGAILGLQVLRLQRGRRVALLLVLVFVLDVVLIIVIVVVLIVLFVLDVVFIVVFI